MLLLQIVIIQTILFGAVIFFLRKIMMGSTESAVNRLNEAYVQMNKKKEELAQKIKQAQEDYEARKKEAERIGEKIKNDADKEARDLKDNILKKAHEEAERMIIDTVGAKEQIWEEIVKEEKIKMVEYCRELLAGVYEDLVRDKVDEVLIEGCLDDVKELDTDSMPAGINQIEVISRKPLSEKLKKKVKELVESKLKGNVDITETVTEDVIGGVTMKFGNLVLDGSVAGKLREKANDMQGKIERGH
jgi:F0F1-type ATP synthase delta subunit/outer membrane murein-binding lipoprotein Lpp